VAVPGGPLTLGARSRGRRAVALLRYVRMEAASRPSLELLPDLPLEEPLDVPPPPREPPTIAPAVSAPAQAQAAIAPARDPEQTDLHFMDPELFLAPGEPGTVPSAPPAAAPVEQPAPLE